MKRYVKEFARDMMNSLSNNAACLPIRKAIENAVRMCERGLITERECIHYILKQMELHLKLLFQIMQVRMIPLIQ